MAYAEERGRPRPSSQEARSLLGSSGSSTGGLLTLGSGDTLFPGLCRVGLFGYGILCASHGDRQRRVRSVGCGGHVAMVARVHP